MQYSKYYNYTVDEFIQEIYRQSETVLSYRDSEAISFIIEEYISAAKEHKKDDEISNLEEDNDRLISENDELQDRVSYLERMLKENNIEIEDD